MKREEELTVSVKALVWSHRNDQPAYEVCADCPFGRYAIAPAGEYGYGWKQPRQNVWAGFLPTCDEAKEAAQADYEARIRSALLPTPKPEPEPVAWRYSFDDGVTWSHSETKPGKHRFGGPDIVEPLYAHPPKPEAEPCLWDCADAPMEICPTTDKPCATHPATEGVDRQVHHSKPVVSQNTQIVGDNATEGGAWDGQSVEALIDQYAHGAYIGQVSKPTISVYRQHFKEFAEKLSSLQAAERPCTCHPDDNPPIPCARKFAYSECVTEGGAHEKGIEAASKALGHEGVYISDATLKRAISAYRAALTAKQTDGREG